MTPATTIRARPDAAPNGAGPWFWRMNYKDAAPLALESGAAAHAVQNLVVP